MLVWIDVVTYFTNLGDFELPTDEFLPMNSQGVGDCILDRSILLVNFWSNSPTLHLTEQSISPTLYLTTNIISLFPKLTMF